MIIIDNTIISDKIFATRLLRFLSDIIVHDAASEEELEYLQRIAKNQIETAIDKNEVNYLNNLYK